jgi:hypothetical protein
MFHHSMIFFLSALLAFSLSAGDKDNLNYQQIKGTAWTAGWSFDDKYVAVGNANGELSIYETTNWRKIKSWKYNDATITRIEWNPKYPILAVAGFSHDTSDHIIQLFDMQSDKIVKHIRNDQQGRALSWSPDGEKIAFVGSRGAVSIYSKTGAYHKTLSFRNNGSLFDIDWHPLKDLLLAVEEDIFILDITADSVLAKYDDGTKQKGILCCQWHPSGKQFVTGDYGHQNEGGEPSYLKYWTENGKLTSVVKQSNYEYRNLRWTKKGDLLAAASDVLLIMDEKANLVRKIKFDENNLWGLGWNKYNNKLILTDGAGAVRITNAKGKTLKLLEL